MGVARIITRGANVSQATTGMAMHLALIGRWLLIVFLALADGCNRKVAKLKSKMKVYNEQCATITPA
jgi:hypothetical protein